MTGSRPDNFTWRHWIISGLMVLLVVAAIARLAQIQIVDHERYLQEAAEMRLGAVEVTAARGAILDASGYPLAISRDTWDLYIDRYLWRQVDRAAEAATALAPLINTTPEALMSEGLADDSGDWLYARDLEYELGSEISELGLWGIRLIPSSVRVYPEPDLAVPLVGYSGIDAEGLWGIELDYDHVLRGTNGWSWIERDALGRRIAFSPQLERQPRPGGEVELTIDRFIQRIAEQVLEDAVTEYSAAGGTILVMNPHTGAVLAMASASSAGVPTLDDGRRGAFSELRNRATTDLYEPGSVIKTLTTAIALDLGLVSPDTLYEDEGSVEVGGYRIWNYDYQARGLVTVRQYLQESLNTGAVWLAEKIGANDFYTYVSRFGLGESTHVGLGGEAEGHVRVPADLDWYPVDLATHAYGHGLSATPLQVLTAVNSFANGGVLMRPYVVSRVTKGDDVRTYEPVRVRQVVSPETAETMKELMHDVVEGVQWHRARVDGYEVAGKTGTTLVSIPLGYDLDSTIVSFAGFLPYDDPQVSILVKLDQPAVDRALGGVVAAPTFSRVAGQIMAHLNGGPELAQDLGR